MEPTTKKCKMEKLKSKKRICSEVTVGIYVVTNSIQIRKSKQPKIQQNKTTLVQSPLTTLGQETRWAYSTTLPSPRGARVRNELAERRTDSVATSTDSTFTLTDSDRTEVPVSRRHTDNTLSGLGIAARDGIVQGAASTVHWD